MGDERTRYASCLQLSRPRCVADLRPEKRRWAVHTVSRGILTCYIALGPDVPPRVLFLENIVSWSVLYSLYTSLILATLLWCTTFIIYRIVRVGGTAGRIHVYQRVIEMLVESASLYSAVLVVLLVFEARNEVAGAFIQNLAVAMRVSTSNLLYF